MMTLLVHGKLSESSWLKVHNISMRVVHLGGFFFYPTPLFILSVVEGLLRLVALAQHKSLLFKEY